MSPAEALKIIDARPTCTWCGLDLWKKGQTMHGKCEQEQRFTALIESGQQAKALTVLFEKLERIEELVEEIKGRVE